MKLKYLDSTEHLLTDCGVITNFTFIKSYICIKNNNFYSNSQLLKSVFGVHGV